MKKAGDLLTSFFDERVLQTAREYSELFSFWQFAAGDTVAAHSRIQELEHSVLLVEADHPGWIQILQTKEKGLLGAFQRRFPDQNITGISFRLSRDRPEFPAEPAITGGGALADDGGSDDVDHHDAVDAAGDDPYERISDEHFRETLKRLEKSIVLKNKKAT